MKHIRSLFGAACLFLLLGVFATAGEPAPVIAILHTNDVHGRFAASGESIGHDRIAAIFTETRRRIPATVLLDAGDAIQGSPLVKWNKGAAAIEIMNAVGYDAFTLGNHEFDYGWETMTRLAGLAEFPVLTQPVVSENAPGFDAAVMFERGGRRIGVFGLTTPETRLSSSGGIGGYFGETEELLAYAAAMTMSLRRAGAEIVVCLSHLGVDDQEGFLTSYDLRDGTKGIDVIIDGHSHTPLAEIVQAAEKALIVSAGEHANALGVVEFYCENGVLVPSARSIAKEETGGVEPAPAVKALIDKWSTESEERGSTVLARTSAALDAARGVVRTREAELGNLVTDAIRAATGCDAALVNGGNLRAPLPAGEVTAAAIDAMLPYDTTVLMSEMPGGVVREALEWSVSRYPREFGGFLQVSGLDFAFDPTRPAGRRVTEIIIGGEPLDDDRLYKIAACDWIAAGGDGYEMMKHPFESASVGKIWILIDIFVHYLGQREGEAPPAIEGRIVPVGG